MTTEEWRPVPGFPDYEVSNLGRVMSHYKKKKPRLLKPVLVKRTGYLRVVLYCDGPSVRRYVHSLVAETFCGSRSAGQQVRHLDGDKLNNAASNLRFGTRSENELDKVQHGTHYQAKKTHCKHGHAFDEANTRYYAGKRNCRACHRVNAERSALRAASVRAEVAA